jgi:F0F1-type ATP synthase assembly protein I
MTMPTENRQTTEPTSVAREATRSLHRSHGSFELALAPVILALLGLWLDRTVGTVPLFAVLFAVLGIVGAFAKVYFEYRHLMAEHDQQGPWVGHTRSEQFRARASARAERLSTPIEERP